MNYLSFSGATRMADVLIAANDDVFWPPTERTEAESHEVASKAGAWIFNFLGSRVQSFSPRPDRVVVFCNPTPEIDAWALPIAMRDLSAYRSVWVTLPQSWAPRSMACFTCVEVKPSMVMRDLGSSGANPTAEFDDDPMPEARVIPSPIDLDVAVSDIKASLGLTDALVESATGISRSTLWRLRTGRSSGPRAVTEAPIWRLHSLTTALVNRLGVEGARGWLHSGDPSPAGLLADGQLPEVERLADRVLFADPASQHPGASASEYDHVPFEVPPPAAGTGPSRPRRVRRRGQPPQ